MGRYFQISIAIVTDVCRDRFRYLSQSKQTSYFLVHHISLIHNLLQTPYFIYTHQSEKQVKWLTFKQKRARNNSRNKM